MENNVVKLTNDQLDDLLKDPNNKVMHYTQREKLEDDEIVPLDIVSDHIDYLCKWHRKTRKVCVRHTWPKNVKDMLSTSVEMRNFKYTHPVIFNTLTQYDLDSKHENTIKYMIKLKKRESHYGVNDAKKKFEDHVIENYSTKKAEAK